MYGELDGDGEEPNARSLCGVGFIQSVQVRVLCVGLDVGVGVHVTPHGLSWVAQYPGYSHNLK